MSHEGCAGSFVDGKAVVDKLRMMGFANQPMPVPAEIPCGGCGETFAMANFEGKCPKCSMVHGVTPCHAFDSGNIMAAGIDY